METLKLETRERVEQLQNALWIAENKNNRIFEEKIVQTEAIEVEEMMVQTEDVDVIEAMIQTEDLAVEEKNI